MFDDVPLLTKVAHGNNDTRLGQWLHSSRSQGPSDIAITRSMGATYTETEGGLAPLIPPASLPTVAVTTRPAKKTRRTAITVTYPHHTTGHTAIDPVSVLSPATTVDSPHLTRRDFIVQFAAAHGVNCAALLDIWQSNKHGYNKAYDAPFARFQSFFRETHPADLFAPTHIRPGDLVAFLQRERESGASFASLKDASASVSMACREATDGDICLGDKDSVKRFLKSVRIHEPAGRRKKLAPSYHDVSSLFQEA